MPDRRAPSHGCSAEGDLSPTLGDRAPGKVPPSSTGSLRESLGEGWCEHREGSWEPEAVWLPGRALARLQLLLTGAGSEEQSPGAPCKIPEGHAFYDLAVGEGVLCKLEISAKKLGVCLPWEGPAPLPSLPTQNPGTCK